MIKVIENALPQDMFDELVSQTTNWGCFPWFYAPNSAYDKIDNDLNQFSWAHSSILEGNDNSDYAQFCRTICQNLEKYHEQTTYGIRRVRFGMHTYSPNHVINNAHIDYSVGSLVGLLYLNDSDGDTYLYDAKYEGEPIFDEEYLKSEWLSVKDNMKVLERISPKANRMVLFDGRQYHASSTPTKNQYRIIMNVNWYVKSPLDMLNF